MTGRGKPCGCQESTALGTGGSPRIGDLDKMLSAIAAEEIGASGISDPESFGVEGQGSAAQPELGFLIGLLRMHPGLKISLSLEGNHSGPAAF